MYHKGELIVDLSREFIDSAGAEHRAKAAVAGVERRNPFLREVAGTGIAEKMRALLSDDNVVSQKGMVEMFDSTIGASTVLMPYGGRTQQTETQVSVQKIPVGEGYTDTASIMLSVSILSSPNGALITVRPMRSWRRCRKRLRRAPVSSGCVSRIRSISNA